MRSRGQTARLVGALAIALVAIAPSSGAAQNETRDAEARNLFEAGRLAMNDGRFEDALGYFERAYELSGRPELLYNVAAMAERLGDDVRTVEALEDYLEGVPDAQDRRAVERRIELLRQRVHEAEEPVVVPTPEQTARAAETSPASAAVAAPDPVADEQERPRMVRRWWFWTLVGAVVVGGAVTAGVLLSRDPGVEDPEPGTNGVVVVALGGGR